MRNAKTIKIATAIIAPLMMSACSLGSLDKFDDVSTNIPTVAFTGNSNLGNSKKTVIASDSGSILSSDNSVNGVNLTTNSSGLISAITVSTSEGDETVTDGKNGYTFDRSVVSGAIYGESAEENTLFIISDAASGEFEYQTFGGWANFDGEEDGEVFSVGDVTTVANIPTSGTATFNGKVLGGFVESSITQLYTSNVQLDADFANQQVAFSTIGSTLDGVSSPGLDMTGTLAISSVENGFSGSVSSGDGLNGTAAGRFYGPAAQEAGGILFAEEPGRELLAAFGAKQ